jgi:hypothetical protein
MKATQHIQFAAMAMILTASAHAAATRIDLTIKPVSPAAIAESPQSTRYVTVGQVKDDLLSGTEKFAQGATRVSEINLDPSTMGIVESGHGPHADLAHKLSLMVVHSYTYDKPGMYRQEDVDALRKKLTDGSWGCSVHIRDRDRSTDICSRAAADHETNEMVIFTASPQKLTFIHMAGKMTLNELDQMSGSAGMIVHPMMPPMPPMSPTPPVPPVHSTPRTPPTPPTPATPATPPSQ